MKNLWPDLGLTENILTPKDILMSQSEYLSSITDGNLQGVIKSSQISFGNDHPDEVEGDRFIHTFIVNAPKIKYSFSLLTISHPALKIFPCEVSSDFAMVNISVNSEEELVDILSKIFNEREVIMAIKSLLLQSNSEEKNKKYPSKALLKEDDDLPF